MNRLNKPSARLCALLSEPRAKESLRYIAVGGATTLISYAAYALLTRVLSVDEYVSEALAWLISVLASYPMNRRFVFGSQNKRVLREFAGFFASRVLAWLVNMGVFALCFGVIGIGDLFAKLAANVVVIVMNYLSGKFVVFKQKSPEGHGENAKP